MCVWGFLGTTAEFAVWPQTSCCPCAGTLLMSSCYGLSCLWFLKYLYFEKETKYFLSVCTSSENYKSFQNRIAHEHSRHSINYVYVHSPLSYTQVSEMAQRKFTYLLSVASFLFEFFLKPRTIVYIFINAGILLWLCRLNSLINPAYSSFFCWHSILEKGGHLMERIPILCLNFLCVKSVLLYPSYIPYFRFISIYWISAINIDWSMVGL